MFKKNNTGFIALLFVYFINGQSIDLNSLDPILRRQILESGADTSSLRSKLNNVIEPNQAALDDLRLLKDDLTKTKDQVSDILNSEKSLNDSIEPKNTVLTDNVDTDAKPTPIDKLNEKKVELVIEEFDRQEQEKNSKSYYFGYNIFDTDPEIFQRSKLETVDPSYVIGPGDEIIIMLWGETEKNDTYVVTKDGYLFIPNIGQVFVNGLTFSSLENKISKLFQKVYSTLGNTDGSAQSFIDISLGSASLRPIRVFVLGEVSQPGAYNVNSGTTLFNSLFYFNGPNVAGSLRDIRLIRNNKEIGKADLYEFLLEGKQSNDFRLMRNDIVFVPPRGKTVRTSGSIGREKYFELNDDEGLIDLIAIAGDIKSETYLKRVSIDRIVNPEDRILSKGSRTKIDVNLRDVIEKKIDFDLLDGDEIQFFTIDNKYLDVLEIQGSVKRPGRYELTKGMRLTDLIQKADSLLGNTYTERAEVLRINNDLSRTITIVNIDSAYKNIKKHNILLKSNDNVKIYSNDEMIFKSNVSINGHVKNPGVKQFLNGMTLFDLVMIGGGFENERHLKNTYFDRADLSIYDANNDLIEIIPFRLDSVLNKSGLANKKIKMGSRVRVYSYEEIFGIPPNSLEIKGHVKRPGFYDYYEGIRVSDLLFLGGGFDDKDHMRRTYKQRIDISRVKEDNITRENIIVNLMEVFLNKSSDSNILLQPRDVITVYNIDNFIFESSVTIAGDIRSPGTYILKNNMTLNDLIIEAGGVEGELKSFVAEVASWNYSLNKNGVETYFDIEIIKKNKSLELYAKNQKINERFLKKDEYIIIRKEKIFSEIKSVSIRGEVLYPGTYILKNNNEKVSEIIKRAGGVLNQAYPLSSEFTRGGETIKLSFEKIIKAPRSKFNFVVQDGDEIKINSKPNLVRVEGEVNNPGTYQFIRGYKYKDYLKMAGGYTKFSSKLGSYVKYPDGTASSITYLNTSPVVYDGSTIVVIKKEEYEPFNVTEYITNLTTIYTNLSQAYLMVLLAGRQ